MTPLRKKAPLVGRMKAVEKELSNVNESLRTLSKAAADGSNVEPAPAPRAGAGTGTPERESRSPAPEASDERIRRQSERLRDERFADYLSSSFQSVRPLKHERKTQRNKAIVMLGIVLIMLVWVVSRIFL